MPLHLRPFPRYSRLAFGSVVDALPVTRDGITGLPMGTLPGESRDCFAQLEVRRHVNGATCRGICGLLPYAAFLDGSVKPHEATLHERLRRQERLVVADGGALGKPVLLTVPSLADWWEKQDRTYRPSDDFLGFAGDNNHYTLRDYLPVAKRSATNAAPSDLPLDVPGPLVIADGHHRAETHARLGERGVPGFSHVPVCLIGADELHIGVFARVIAATGVEVMFKRLRHHFRVEPIDRPLAPVAVGQWLLRYQDRCYRLHRRVSPGDVTDVEWLNRIVLPEACGITDVRADERITFAPVGDPVDGLHAETFPPSALVLIGFPLPTARFFAEVGAGRVLPPKSTKFEPRVPSGLVVWRGSR